MIISIIEQNSEAWFDNRLGRITSTRFKNLMSKESTDSYKDLINKIVIEILIGKTDPGFSNEIMEDAKDDEKEARLAYENHFGIEIEQVGFIIPDEDHKYHEWIGISPDGLTKDNGMIEIKCPLMHTHLGYIIENKLPPEYRYQVQGQLFVTDFDYCDFISYCEGMKLFIIRVYPDKELFAEFEQRLDRAITQIKEQIEMYNKYDFLNE